MQLYLENVDINGFAFVNSGEMIVMIRADFALFIVPSGNFFT